MLRIGTAQAVITPPIGTPLAGYFSPRPSQGIHDDLYCRALVLDDGETVLAHVACDLISVRRALVAEVRRLVEEATGIPGERVAVSATHIHTGPYTSRLLKGGTDSSYLAILPRTIAGAVIAAYHSRSEGRLGIGSGHVESIAFNRRYVMRDGGVRTNPGVLNPDIVAPAGPIDPQLGVLKATDPAGNPRALWVNYTVHTDVVGGEFISADYPGYLARAVQAVLGPQVIVPYANGASGDLNHINVKGPGAAPEEQRGQEHARWMGTILAGEALRVFMETPTTDEVRLDAASETFTIPVREVPADLQAWARERLARAEAKRAAAEDDPATDPYHGAVDSSEFVEDFYAWAALQVAKEREEEPEVTAEVQVFRIGDAAICFNPAELFVAFGLRMKEASPFQPTFVVELANACVGYVPTPEAFTQGGYEPRTAPSSKLVPEAGDQITEVTLKLLRQLDARR
ncbi:MAG TPA: neutral/alkaline non-lysosomal ceramidase N-terminal domain-containing protein [Armatimonadota bacterium]|jgi:neutral ceramidase|nr:hypothetical protein [Armatimonadota bacterium]HOM80644.1 neutral/alkaline non-lysosomal ceramidase N-terminal domain-containing protein [Armatimonadota bacterium]HPO72162.1 neutral/alkaline non-lysosomal ceramidase N-terminal domain-containing protein [Armatimonadota bacterium]HPT98596.1 neutral/alkaline non-lysosomal ceramidase N-terminal domain-containing protein [Armatimonadota bacterium]